MDTLNGGWRARLPDPEVRSFLRIANVVAPRSLAGRSPRQVHRSVRSVVWALSSREPVGRVERLSAVGPGGPIAIRLYVPAGPAPATGWPVLAWFHGGGFVTGDQFVAEGTCRALANRSGAAVAAITYRLAHRHGLLAGHEDALAAVRWLAAQGAAHGLDPARIAVGGDSAGGCLAASVAARCAAGEGPALALQLLLYPVTDMTLERPSINENAAGYLLTRDSLAWVLSNLRADVDLTDPRVSPARAELRGAAPAVVLTCGYDPLRDDGLAYVERLKAAGVPVEHLHFAGQVHGFVMFDVVFRGARQALDQLGAALARALGTAPRADRPRPPLATGHRAIGSALMAVMALERGPLARRPRKAA
ncbi:alpha/beta hydrolase fold domain-containing protein [Zavarzinia sp. CC-PAN008]|uniref:alpha/beta hydrolase fold domain-containing protein n=1 Tax=Zavarzinia sp. CC-PAN008 TaxID=3243332 RepID=UPI003F74335D